MAIGTLLKFIIGLAGIVLTLVFIIMGIVRKDNSKLKKGGLIFLGTWVILIVLGTLEFLILK